MKSTVLTKNCFSRSDRNESGCRIRRRPWKKLVFLSSSVFLSWGIVGVDFNLFDLVTRFRCPKMTRGGNIAVASLNIASIDSRLDKILATFYLLSYQRVEKPLRIANFFVLRYILDKMSIAFLLELRRGDFMNPF